MAVVHGLGLGSQQSQQGVLQVGHQAEDRSKLTVEPAKKPGVSSHENK